MNNKLLKPVRWAWFSFVGGLIFFSSLIGNTHCAEVPRADIDPSSVKQVAYTLIEGKPLTEEHAFQFMRLLPFEAQICIIANLTTAQQCQWRLVSKKYCCSIDLFFFGPVYDPQMQVMAFSSETSGGTIGGHILDLLGTAQRRVIIASDKCTNEEFLDDLLVLHRRVEHPLEIRIVTGQDERTNQLLAQEKYREIVCQAIPIDEHNGGKMHNKFIVVDDRFVITGSPNLTYAAYNYNIESFVAIYHRFVAHLYYRYYEYIVSDKHKKDHTQIEYQRVEKMMHVFNTAPYNPLRVCLAPILDIKGFVIHELNDTQLININMFLVARATEPDNDIIDNLLRVAREGTNITIKVDGGQYQQMRYVRRALNPLLELRQTVYTVTKNKEEWRTRTKTIQTIPQFHDKLVLVHQRNGVKKVFIGSAGFSEHVQDNVNLENMILIFIPGIYDYLLGHFNAINSARLNVTKL